MFLKSASICNPCSYVFTRWHGTRKRIAYQKGLEPSYALNQLIQAWINPFKPLIRYTKASETKTKRLIQNNTHKPIPYYIQSL